MHPSDIIGRLSDPIQTTINSDSVVCSGVNGYSVIVKVDKSHYVANMLCNRVGLMVDFTFNFENIDILTENVEKWCKGLY